MSRPAPDRDVTRVVHVKSGYGRVGGIETLLEQMLPALATLGVESRLIFVDRAPNDALVRRISGGAAKTTFLPWNGLASAPAVSFRMARLLDAMGADLVHTHDMRANLLAALSKPVRHVPWLCQIHGWLGPTHSGWYRLYEAVDRRLVRLSDRVVVGSHAALEEVRHAGARRASVVWNAIKLPSAPDPGDLPALRRRLGLADDRPLVITLGRLHHGKGQDVLIRAAAMHPDEQWMIVLLGEGEAEQELRALAAASGIDGRIRFAGFVDDPLEFASAADIVVIPSRRDSLPLACLEAMALAKPVVASSTGDLRLVVEDGHSGLLVPPDDPVALAGAIHRLLVDPDLAGRMGEAARRRVLRNHSIEGLAAGMLQLYQEMSIKS